MYAVCFYKFYWSSNVKIILKFQFRFDSLETRLEMSERDEIVRDIVAEVVELKIEKSRNVGNIGNVGSKISFSPTVRNKCDSVSSMIRKKSDSVSSNDEDYDNSYDDESDHQVLRQQHKSGFIRKQKQVTFGTRPHLTFEKDLSLSLYWFHVKDH